MRIAIVGVGAIGGVLAARLMRAGHAVVLCTRRPLTAFRVDGPDGATQVRAANWTAPEQAAPVDWVLVTLKAYDTAAAKAWLARLTGPETRVAVVQNGVEHRERFAPEFAVLPVIIDTPAERREDGSVLQRKRATMHVENSADGRAFAALFGGEADVQTTDDFTTAAWRKLTLNAAGVLNALTRQPAGVLRDEALGRVALDVMRECIAVARAEGATLDDGLPEQVLQYYRESDPASVNSLLADTLAGRPTEIDERNGVIVRRGERHGIATPANRMAVALMTVSR